MRYKGKASGLRLEETLQLETNLVEKVFPIMTTFFPNKTFVKLTPLRKENLFTRFNVACHRCPGIRISFQYTRTLLSGKEGDERTGTGSMFEKMLCKIVGKNRGRDT